jgi:hypothetical protein
MSLGREASSRDLSNKIQMPWEYKSHGIFYGVTNNFSKGEIKWNRLKHF